MSISILLALSILPVVLLMVFIYRQDKYQKEPIKSLAKAFIGGMIAIPLDLMIVRLLGMVYQSNTIFYTALAISKAIGSCIASGATRTLTNTWTVSYMLLSSG